MMLVSLLSYIDRNTLAILAPTILADTHLSGEQYGFIISCFSFVYTVGNPVWGILIDRIGVRRGMAAAVGLWTAASAAHAWASGFGSFAAARALLGAGEGATFPGGLRTVTSTLSPSSQGRGLAVAYSGGSLGAMIAPLIVTPIALWFGWRGAFLATGLFGGLWLILWTRVGRSVEPATPVARASIPWRTRPFWSYILFYGVGALPLGFLLYESSIYLHVKFGWTQATLGKILWIPPCGWEVGYFVWGAVIDRLGPRLRSMTFLSVLLSAPFFLIPRVSSPTLVLAMMFLEMFACGGIVVLSVAYGTRSHSRAHSGLIAGVGAGSWGASVAVMMPIFGRMFDGGKYGEAFLIAGLFPLAGAVLWRLTSRPSDWENLNLT